MSRRSRQDLTLAVQAHDDRDLRLDLAFAALPDDPTRRAVECGDGGAVGASSLDDHQVVRDHRRRREPVEGDASPEVLRDRVRPAQRAVASIERDELAVRADREDAPAADGGRTDRTVARTVPPLEAIADSVPEMLGAGGEVERDDEVARIGSAQRGHRVAATVPSRDRRVAMPELASPREPQGQRGGAFDGFQRRAALKTRAAKLGPVFRAGGRRKPGDQCGAESARAEYVPEAVTQRHS